MNAKIQSSAQAASRSVTRRVGQGVAVALERV